MRDPVLGQIRNEGCPSMLPTEITFSLTKTFSSLDLNLQLKQSLSHIAKKFRAYSNPDHPKTTSPIHINE